MALTDKYRIVSIPHGCTSLTAANITGLTPNGLQAMATTEINKARVIAESLEAKAVGVVAKPFTELLYSRISEVGKSSLNERKLPDNQSLILPFSYRTRRTNVGYEYFNITAGAVSSAAGTTVGGITYPTSSWNLTVNVGPSAFNSALDTIQRYFLPGEYLYVENVNAAGTAGVDRSRRVTPFKIINAVYVSPGVCTVTVAANRTDTAWAALTSGQKAVWQPTFGVATIGTNSVGDYESWCYNQPAESSKSLITDWHQTSRYSQCYNDEYARILKEILDGNVNEFAKNFAGYESLADQNKKQRMVYESKLAHDILYGDIIDERQSSVESYATLQPIVDVEDGTVYGYKTRAQGLRTLLAAEARVIDMQGGALNLDNLLKESYTIHRERKSTGDDASVIDWMTDKDTALLIHVTMLKFLKDTYGFTAQTMMFEPGKVVDNVTNFTKFQYNRYSIPGMPYSVAVFVEDFFTDRATNFLAGTGGTQGSVDFAASGRSIWAIDWNDYNLGIVATNSAKREYKGKVSADANALFSCVISMNTKHYDLRSTTWCSQLGNARRHAIFENFSLGAMTIPDYNPYS